MGQDCLTNDVTFVSTLRRDRPEEHELLTGLSRLHTLGISPDWHAYYAGTGTHRIDLPTYAFQHERYWLDTKEYLAELWHDGGDVVDAGLETVGHPFVGAAVWSPEGDSVTFTGRLSAKSAPWLADHSVNGLALFPGTGFVELVLAAGVHVGCGMLEELTLEAPLVLPERRGVAFQIVVGEDKAGRTVTVYSRDESSDGPWTRNASGLLTTDAAAEPAPLTEWPPRGAEVLPVEGLYGELAEAGFGYGPVFQGLRAAWRRGEELFAEVALPDGADDAAAYGLHPALFDACLHLIGLTSDGGPARVPFAWSGVPLHATGAAQVRVRLVLRDAGTVSLDVFDGSGAAVLAVESLVLREPSVVRPVRHDDLYRVEWTPVSVDPSVSASAVTVLKTDPGVGTDAVHASVQWALAELRSRLGSEDRLAFVTRGAVALPGEDVTDLAGAAVWGLVRSAQAEHPGRFVLIDLDTTGDTADDDVAVRAALATGEPQTSVRGGTVCAARLVRVPAPSPEAETAPAAVFGPDGVVLVTGAGGALGGVVARHLVSAHGVRR
ncbi:polyketide synthase dehydratase domain-containing protein, partial [Streptomyces sp. NPDC054786]